MLLAELRYAGQVVGISCGLIVLMGLAFLVGRAGHLSSAAAFAVFIAMLAVALTSAIFLLRYRRTAREEPALLRAVYAPIAIPLATLLYVAHELVDEIPYLEPTHWRTGSDIFIPMCALALVLVLQVLSACGSMLASRGR